MKTTIDLPDALVRDLKVRAAREDRSLKDVVTEVLRIGLAVERPASSNRISGPLVVCAHPADAGREVTPDRVAEILLDQDIERLEA